MNRPDADHGSAVEVDDDGTEWDERDSLIVGVPYVMSEACPWRVDAEPKYRRCSSCGSRSQALPASDLWVIKEHRSNNPAGALRIYCAYHLDRMGSPGTAGGGTSGPVGAVCPHCFIATPAGTGICESCGWKGEGVKS